MHALEYDFSVTALHVQNTLIAQHARAVNIDDSAQKVFELARIEGPLGFKYKTLDVIVYMVVVSMRLRVAVRRMVAVRPMVVMAMIVVMPVIVTRMVMVMVRVCGAQKLRVNVQCGIEIKTV